MKPIAIQFSGGKDSLALLHLWRDQADLVRVYFGDTGAVYPHVTEYVRRTCDRLGYELAVVTPPMPLAAFHEKHGLPSDIVPVEAGEFADFGPPRQKLQPYTSCCGAMLWQPMYRRMVEDGIRYVIRGSKRSDKLFFARDGHKDDNGIEYHMPLQDWSDEDVFAYLRSEGAELAEHYQAFNGSADCWACTAFLHHTGAADKLRWTRERYPDLWPELARRIALVRAEVRREMAALEPAYSAAGEVVDAVPVVGVDHLGPDEVRALPGALAVSSGDRTGIAVGSAKSDGVGAAGEGADAVVARSQGKRRRNHKVLHRFPPTPKSRAAEKRSQEVR